MQRKKVKKRWYTYKEMQKHTGLSRTTLYKYGKRPPFDKCFKKLGHMVRIDADLFDDIMRTYDY